MQRMAQKLQNQATTTTRASVDQKRFSLIRHTTNNNNNATTKTTSSSSSSSRPRGIVRTTSAKVLPASRSYRRQYSYVAPGAGEVLIKRALAPPKRRFALRWVNFRPTPSRLSNMSIAA